MLYCFPLQQCLR